MRRDRDVNRALARYSLVPPDRVSRRVGGNILGRESGDSVEFQDYRQYVPGDDLRHLDWRAYGRSDTPMVRLFRDETSPSMEILLDESRSMSAISASKAKIARQLAATLVLLARGIGDLPRIVVLDDSRPAHVIGTDAIGELAELRGAGTSSLAELLERGAVPPGRRSMRIVISDFLFPHDPVRLVGKLAGEASSLVLLQVLSRFEAEPGPLGGRRLVDCETGEAEDLFLDPETIGAYRRRLERLQRGLRDEARRRSARFLPVVAEEGLEAICRVDLCAAGILQPA